MNRTNEVSCFGVVPLSREEELETGGGVGWVVPALIAGLIISAVNNFGDIREGFSDGYNGTPRH